MNMRFAAVEGLGILDYLKIYGFYDEPLMFSCQSQNGTKYLLLRLPDKQAKWLAAEVTDVCLDKLETGCIEMRNPFIHSENGYSYVISSNSEPYSVSLISSGNITEDMLPYAGEYLTDSGTEAIESEIIFDDSKGQVISNEKPNPKWESLLSKIDRDNVFDQYVYLKDLHMMTTVYQNKHDQKTNTSFALSTEGNDAA